MTPSVSFRRRPTRKKQIRRLLCESAARLDELAVPEPCDMAGLIECVSRLRGRPIELLAAPVDAAHPSGAWVSLSALDLVIYEANTSKLHQEHIIAHELGHVIYGHCGGALDDDNAQLLFPGLDPSLVREMLNRAEYSDRHELEAEVMASVILRRMNRPAHYGIRSSGSPDADVLGRVEQSLSANAGAGA